MTTINGFFDPKELKEHGTKIELISPLERPIITRNLVIGDSLIEQLFHKCRLTTSYINLVNECVFQLSESIYLVHPRSGLNLRHPKKRVCASYLLDPLHKALGKQGALTVISLQHGLFNNLVFCVL